MFEINTATQTPENFHAGEYPAMKDIGEVQADKTVKKYEPVKLVGGKIEPIVYIEANAAHDYAAAVAAVHTLVVALAVTAGDTVTINGNVYTAVASTPVAADKEFVEGTAAEAAASLKSAVELVETNFNVANSDANITFTQKVAGVGTLPTLETSVENAASISTTTPYVAELDPAPARTAAENTAEGLYGIAVQAAEAGEDVIIYCTGEFFANAIEWPESVTQNMLKPYFHKLGIFLK